MGCVVAAMKVRKHDDAEKKEHLEKIVNIMLLIDMRIHSNAMLHRLVSNPIQSIAGKRFFQANDVLPGTVLLKTLIMEKQLLRSRKWLIWRCTLISLIIMAVYVCKYIWKLPNFISKCGQLRKREQPG
ncbi:hypothetical protein Tsp_10047 [Trichinella spiralis]|uniref:hypothetical protein n=1 Tax=Trichinella spiralis TaxID=6334 RepID=UPI0001EFCF27|nr:hypothetical protein Tsp_10047 [Trichinella spiralis]